MRIVVAICFAQTLYLLASVVLVAEESSEYPGFDSEFAALSPSFLVRKDASSVKDSDLMEDFLGRFDREYYLYFSGEDAEKIRAHWLMWLDDYARIQSATNAYNYQVLQKFYGMKAEDFDVDMMMEYEDTYEMLEDKHEERLLAHHERLIAELTTAGAGKMRELINTDVRLDAYDAYVTGARGGSKTDIRAFIRAYPDVVARQCAIEVKTLIERGPPKELVWEQAYQEEWDSDQRLGVLRLVPKRDE
ncbi:MAG: hypothetical protein Cons2KO_26210 [Congregibacter sp.]